MSDKPEPIILFHEYGLELRLDPSGDLILNVMCGRILEYCVEFSLNEVEVASYKAKGDAFLKELSAEVQADPQAFAARGRFC